MANKNSWVASAASRRQIAIATFWDTVNSLWPDEYDYSQFEYNGATTPSTVICKRHGPFTTKPTYLVNGNGCPHCGQEKVRALGVSRRAGVEKFAVKARYQHGELYDYSRVQYVNNKVPVEILCRTHGSFWQKPNHHLSGRGCPECANDGKRAKNKLLSDLTKEGLLGRLQVANSLWQYDIASFSGMAKALSCLCPVHGAFSATPNNLLQNSGCIACGHAKHAARMVQRRLTTEEWVASALRVHADTYDYSEAVYVDNATRVAVICRKHGVFHTTNDHIYQATGCPRCALQLSKQEDRIAALLRVFAEVRQRDRALLRPRELDVYLPTHKLAIEYCGDYWHSHGNTQDEARDKHRHYKKYIDCRAQGVRLITLFETEWHHRTYAVKRLLRNAVGKARGRLMARKCELRQPTLQEARAFYERYHPQGGAGSGEHYGLYWRGKLVACMRFTFGANDRGSAVANRAWTLTRYATRVSVAGGASRLFKAFLREHTPTEVKSFSDNRFFDGGMYTQLGFVLEEETPPDYQVWSPKIGLRPKAHYQRRLIPARLLEHKMDEVFDPDTDPRSESEMTYLMGARRIYDCGKKRWVWRRSN